MTKITENDIELWAIEELENLGWKYMHGGVIAPDGEVPERNAFSDVILKGRLQQAIARNNLDIPSEAQMEAVKVIERISSPELMVNNQLFHELLSEGVPVEYRKDGVQRGDRVQLVNFDQPGLNDFLVVNQFTIIENNHHKRPDLILFVNGLPLVIFELKNAVDENATLHSAFKQIQTYKDTIPGLFTFNAFCVLSDGADAKAGSLSAGFTRYMAWKTSDGLKEASILTNQLEVLIKGLTNPATLLDFIRYFIVFEESKHIDAKGIATIQTIKMVAAYHQYYAVNKAIESVKRASGNNGDRKGGVVWHTQGSGKSLSMVFFSGKLVLQLDNPTILVITDRNDLDDQLFDTFASSKQLLRQVPVQAESREHLKELLKVASGGIVFATIQKFQTDSESNTYEQLSDRTNIVVVADEAHRTQYGFKPKSIDVKDDRGNVVGQRLVYGFAKYMRDALPNATYLGFTGTPVESTDNNTPVVFGNYVDIYDIAQAVEDGATVPIYYESRLVKINLSEEGKQLIEELDEELESDELTDTQKAKAKWTKVAAIVGSPARLKKIAEDIVFHYEERNNSGIEGKAMVVTMSRQIAVDLYKEIINIRPHWHSDDLDKGVIKVVMTASSSDGPDMMKHHTSKEQRRTLADRMKDIADPMKLVIVRDMWLTGFDAPSLHTLYIDKPMKGHNLMQAIARVNRVYKDKPGGLVVDYFGIASDLKKALSFYADSGGKGDPAEAQEQAVQLMLEKLEVVSQMFSENGIQQHEELAMAAEPKMPYGKGVVYEEYFDAPVKQKLEIILTGVEHILSLEDGKNRYIREVTALSKAFAIALPHDEAMDAKDEIAYFQAVKARLVKFETRTGGKTDYEIDTAIKQVIDKALVSEQVVDIFDAAGIKKPELSVLDDEFLEEMRDMKHKNLALEVLKKLLNDEIKIRSRHNIVQSRSLMEMLESSIKRYQNNLISAAEIIQEMINLAKEIKEADKRGEKMGLSKDELAFYDAVAQNQSAKDLLGDDILFKLARVLVERVKANASIDWTVKESVKKKLKVIVKRTLRQYGYPPDLQKLATETVLSQAEALADFWN
ncbi:type I restriction endonuclease subunit R [Geofilum rubicundum]|uniref:Type I restriction enzyme endonuclease subunit n=1 Tax=Geofilum rubicundum JCM 15548 TaxID=1236989 RepID=A0A0E9M0J2_9BACT|nr:type I restriction endonuclease subunit R [Geofilum rubicundum]GAO31352.1 type I restriction-modification system, restriction subunit R [Geofilum rubicundum JCM 15548]